jgi:hypothetical protein
MLLLSVGRRVRVYPDRDGLKTAVKSMLLGWRLKMLFCRKFE